MTRELEALFFRKYRYSLPDEEHPDEEESDKLVLFVMDEFPVETINTILRKDASKFYGEGKVTLADTYEKLPDFRGFKVTKGTKTPINPAWRSPFVGKTLADAVSWIRGIPKPPKAANKVYFAVLRKELYEARKKVLMCKVVEGESEPQTIPCSANRLTAFQLTYYNDQWEDMHTMNSVCFELSGVIFKPCLTRILSNYHSLHLDRETSEISFSRLQAKWHTTLNAQ